MCLGIVSGLLAYGCTGSETEKSRAASEKPAEPKPAPPPSAIPPPSSAPKAAEAPPAAPGAGNPALLDPSLAREKSPEKFKVKVTTTKGDFVIEITRSWSPNGADRFYNLAKIGFFNDVAIFRVVRGFVAQFGLNGDPQVSAKWRSANIPDDPVQESNGRGFVTFAKSGLPNSRSTQLFINLVDNPNLDGMGFSPIGRVVQGMEIVDSIYSGYGESPNQGSIQMQGNRYLRQSFPNLDYIKSAAMME